MKIEDFNSFFGTRVKLQCITVKDYYKDCIPEYLQCE